MQEGERRLAAIMFTDMVGYTALTQSNEARGFEILERHNRLLRPFFPRFHGREVKTIGDSFLVEFESALDALRCAVEVQSFLHDYNLSSKNEWMIRLRIGIHLGDVIHKKDDVFGDAVNIASRIESIAEPEGICITQQVYDQVHRKIELQFLDIGRKQLKNVSEDMELFRVVMPWEREYEHDSTMDVHRIAVLPFASFSPDPNDAYFADGITDEIISTVSGISGLSVISRTSVMGYKGTPKRIEEIGRELKVGSVLEGSFKKAGNRIRVTAQLIDVAGDKHLWAQNYDKNLDDMFEVQSDVARQVADALRVRILAPEKERIDKKPTENITAYTLYLKGKYLWNKRGLEEIQKAIEFYEQAIREDAGFALGYLGLADCYLVLKSNWNIDMDPGHQKTRTALAKAIEIDPSLAESQATMGLLLYEDYHLREAEQRYRKAVELKPSYAFAHMWYFVLLSAQLRWDEALSQIEKALELDPLSPVINLDYASCYYEKREYSKALELFKRVIELDSNYSPAYAMIGMAYGKLKQFEEMERSCEVYVELMKESFPMVKKAIGIWTALYRDDKDTVKRLLPEIETHPKETLTGASDIAGFYIYLGEFDKGFEWLERAYSEKEFGLLGIRSNDLLDGIRSDPRYLDMLKRLELDSAFSSKPDT